MRAIRLATATAAALIGGLSAPGAWAACYVIHDANQQVIYRSQTPPVDMSRNLHETLPKVAPGGTLVFSLDSNGCELELNLLRSNPEVGTGKAAVGAGGAGRAAPRVAPRASGG